MNLVWMTLAMAALSAFLRRRRSCAWTAGVPYLKAVLAIGCMLVLLFPVVSASDDLHPTQAVLEDATRRIHQLTAPLGSNARDEILPAMLGVCLLGILLAATRRQPEVKVARVLVRARTPRPGRAPPTP